MSCSTEPVPRTWGDWESRVNEGGSYYYYNTTDELTSYEQPIGWGWRAEWSKTKHNWFYHNVTTGEVVWKPPAEIPYSVIVIRKGNEHIPHPLKWKDWIASLSKTHDNWFYFSTITRVTTWSRPSGWGGISTEEDTDGESTESVCSVVDVSNNRIPQSCDSVSHSQTNSEKLHLVQRMTSEERIKEAIVMTKNLELDSAEVRFHVDCGDFGRPVTASGILSNWNPASKGHEVFAASVGNQQVGHVELLSYKVNPSMLWCHWSGVESYTVLAYVYVFPRHRNKRFGTKMVREACRHAFEMQSPSKKVCLLLEESNLSLIRFYNNIGFKVTDQIFQREEAKLLLLEMEKKPK